MNKFVLGWEKSSAAWFAIRTRPGKEELAQFHLHRQGYETFLPKIRIHSSKRRKGGVELRPFFPSYLFVRLDLNVDTWRPIDGTIGVSKIVKFGIAPTPLPKGLIEELQFNADRNGVLGFKDELKKGDNITIVGGAFHQIKGVFEAETDQERVEVLLSMMSRQVRIVVPRVEVMASRS